MSFSFPTWSLEDWECRIMYKIFAGILEAFHFSCIFSFSASG